MYQFGIGGVFGVPLGGNLATPSFPQQFAVIQDVHVEMDQKLVELRGQSKAPDDVAPGDMTVKGKAGFGKVEIDLYNSLFFGDAISTGVTIILGGDTKEAGAIPGAGPYTITVTHSANFVEDFGVVYASNLQQLTQIPSGTPAQGQYKVTAGVYTFAAADTGLAVFLSYSYTAAGVGRTMLVKNHTQGYGPTFELWLSQPYQGTNGMHLFQCRASKMSAPMKRDGYLISDFEFEAYPNNAGNWFEWFQTTI